MKTNIADKKIIFDRKIHIETLDFILFFGMRCYAGKEGTGECCDLRVTRKSWNSA